MKTLFVFLAAVCGTLLHAGEVVIDPTPAPMPAPSVSRQILWRASMTALATANAIDIHSSWGKHELNPALMSPSGNFGSHGALIKLGFQGGLMGIEYLITRRHPSGKVYRALSMINFGAAAAIGSVAVHNYTVPRSR